MVSERPLVRVAVGPRSFSAPVTYLSCEHEVLERFSPRLVSDSYAAVFKSIYISRPNLKKGVVCCGSTRYRVGSAFIPYIGLAAFCKS